jgi:hypothetical protein
MKRSQISDPKHEPRSATVGDLRAQLEGLEDNDQVLVEFPGAVRPVAGIAVRATPEHGLQLVVLADL